MWFDKKLGIWIVRFDKKLGIWIVRFDNKLGIWIARCDNLSFGRENYRPDDNMLTPYAMTTERACERSSRLRSGEVTRCLLAVNPPMHNIHKVHR